MTRRPDSQKERIIAALTEARRVRHHKDCHCRLFDKQFCNPADALWQRALNRELEQMSTDTEQGVSQ